MGGHPDVPISISGYKIAEFVYKEKPIIGETYTIIIKGKLGGGKTHWKPFNTTGYIPMPDFDHIIGDFYSVTINSWYSTYGGGAQTDNSKLEIYAFPNNMMGPNIIEYAILVPGTLDDLNWIPTSQDWTNEIDRRINLLK